MPKLVSLLAAFLAAAGALPLCAASVPVVAVDVSVWSGRSRLMLIDPDALTVTSTVEFERFATPLAYDAGGSSLFVVTSRQGSKKPVTLWTVDVTSGAATSLGKLGRSPIDWSLDTRGERLLVVTTPNKKTKEVSYYDLAARRPLGTVATIEHGTAVLRSPDGTLLYAFCRGKKHKRPKGPSGSLHVLDAGNGSELARLDLGADARSVAFDPGRGLAYVLGVADLEGRGRLTILHGAAIASQFDVRGRPSDLRIAPDGRSFLLTESAVVALDAEGLAIAHTWPLSFAPADLLFDPVHDVMFAGAGKGSDVAVMPMSGGEVLASHPTGSAGRKFGKGVGQALYGIVAVAAAAGGAPVGDISFGHNSTEMTLSDDGSVLYVLNPYTNDVSVFDVARGDVVEIVHTGGGSSRIIRLPGDPNIWVQSRGQLVRFNTMTHRVDHTLDFHASIAQAAVGVDEARRRAWIGIGTRVLVLDLATAQIVGQFDLPHPASLIWVDPPYSAAP